MRKFSNHGKDTLHKNVNLSAEVFLENSVRCWKKKILLEHDATTAAVIQD